MVEGVLVDASPIAADKGADEQKKRGLRLMEIGDEVGDDFVLVARHDDDLRGGGERVEVVAVEPVENRVKGVDNRSLLLTFVELRFPSVSDRWLIIDSCPFSSSIFNFSLLIFNSSFLILNSSFFILNSSFFIS